MIDKELRKLKRRELLEILLAQTKRIEELEQELEKTQILLEDKNVSIKKSGSLAEASLQLSGIFKSADEAAKIYLNNIKENMKKKKVKP